MPDTSLRYVSGGLEIFPELDESRNEGGETVRLGPVNMRVLELLVRCPGQLVSRAELFDGVWTNQSVSDDALTRAMSDIRAELKRLTGREGQIETIPKRGYSWPEPVDVRSSAETASEAGSGFRPGGHAGKRSPFRTNRLIRWTTTGLGYLGALLLLASAGVWLLERITGQPFSLFLFRVRRALARRKRASAIARRLVLRSQPGRCTNRHRVVRDRNAV